MYDLVLHVIALPFSREWRTRDILCRYVSVEEELDEQETFLREKLNVPVEWIHHAKVSKQEKGHHPTQPNPKQKRNRYIIKRKC